MQNITCSDCGIIFGVPDHWLTNRRADAKLFCCPNGHGQSFRESTADKLRRERDQLQQRLAQKDDEIKWQSDLRKDAERRVSAAKSQITKLKKRAKAGTCPCCNRTFSNMTAHMKTQHPEFDPNIVDFGEEKLKRGERR